MGIEAFHDGGISPSGERSRYAIRFRFLPLPFPLSPLPSFLSSPIPSNRRRTRLVEIKSDWKRKKKEIHVSRHSPHILAALRIVFVPGTGGRVSAATFRPPCDAVFISVGVESIRVYSWTSGYCKMARYGMTRIKRV